MPFRSISTALRAPDGLRALTATEVLEVPMTQKWPEKMTKTRKEMSALGLPGGGRKGGAVVVEDTITEQGRWTTSHDLIFRLPDMPDDLAYQTYYREGSTEQQDESPWEYDDAVCALVRKVPKVVEVWEDASAVRPARIHVADLDPSTLVGIAPCDDGEEGWVVMAVQPDPDAPTMEIVAPVGDQHGQLVYMNILDAAEVLKTGIVWKHDMGEDTEEVDDPDSGPLEATDDPDSGPLDTASPTAT